MVTRTMGAPEEPRSTMKYLEEGGERTGGDHQTAWRTLEVGGGSHSSRSPAGRRFPLGNWTMEAAVPIQEPGQMGKTSSGAHADCSCWGRRPQKQPGTGSAEVIRGEPESYERTSGSLRDKDLLWTSKSQQKCQITGEHVMKLIKLQGLNRAKKRGKESSLRAALKQQLMCEWWRLKGRSISAADPKSAPYTPPGQ